MVEYEKLDPIVKEILIRRGIDTREKAEEYFSPLPRMTFNPFLMKNMEAVCDRILLAVERKEKICIYGDYDADGVTSVTLLMEYLGHLTSNLTYYIPSRFEEGYGLNDQASDRLASEGVSLIITVDCGCTGIREVEHIKELGMDIIVTDHHAVDPERMPDCLMIDAKQPGESYPYQNLCGCGVAFKVAQALKIRKNLPKKDLNHCLDLVGVATVADVVPLDGENRTLVKYGIDRIKKRERPGMKSLLDGSKINAAVLKSYNIAFGIAPRINSAGRLSTASHGVSLLSAPDETTAERYAEVLENLNTERKTLQDAIYEEAVKKIDAEYPEDPFIIYHAGKAHEGVTGIAAGKLREHYHKPVIIVSESVQKGFLKGTGRSVEKLDLFRMLNQHVLLFEKFGGHAAACGFTIAEDRLEELRRRLLEEMSEIVRRDPSVIEEELKTEAVIRPEQVTLSLAQQIAAMEPFGKDNEQPLFLVESLYIQNVYSMGNEKQYRKFQFHSGDGIAYAVAFDTKLSGIYDVMPGDTISVFAEVNVNTWNGTSRVQLVIRKIVKNQTSICN